MVLLRTADSSACFFNTLTWLVNTWFAILICWSFCLAVEWKISTIENGILYIKCISSIIEVKRIQGFMNVYVYPIYIVAIGLAYHFAFNFLAWQLWNSFHCWMPKIHKKCNWFNRKETLYRYKTEINWIPLTFFTCMKGCNAIRLVYIEPYSELKANVLSKGKSLKRLKIELYV